MKKTLPSLFCLFMSLCSMQAERLVLVSASYGKNILALTNAKGEVLWSHGTAGPNLIFDSSSVFSPSLKCLQGLP